MHRWSTTRHKDITDGTSKTFLIAELSWDIFGNRIWIAGSNGTRYSYSGRNLKFPLNSVPYKPYYDAPDALDNPNNDVSFGSTHPGGCHFGMADGSCHFIREDISLDVLQYAATRKHGEQGDLQ